MRSDGRGGGAAAVRGAGAAPAVGTLPAELEPDLQALLLLVRGEGRRAVLVGCLSYRGRGGWRFRAFVAGSRLSRRDHASAWEACARWGRPDDRVLTWDEAADERLVVPRKERGSRA